MECNISCMITDTHIYTSVAVCVCMCVCDGPHNVLHPTSNMAFDTDNFLLNYAVTCYSTNALMLIKEFVYG